MNRCFASLIWYLSLQSQSGEANLGLLNPSLSDDSCSFNPNLPSLPPFYYPAIHDWIHTWLSFLFLRDSGEDLMFFLSLRNQVRRIYLPSEFGPLVETSRMLAAIITTIILSGCPMIGNKAFQSLPAESYQTKILFFNSTLVPPCIHISQGVPETKRRAIRNVASNAYDMINHHRSRAR